MQAIEFEADVENFSIRVPKKFGVLEKKHIRLVALYETDNMNKNEARTESFIDRIISNPLRISGFTPLKRDEIYAG